jgi:hypothetical protein
LSSSRAEQQQQQQQQKKKKDSLKPTIGKYGLQMPVFDEAHVDKVAQEACSRLQNCRNVDFRTARWFAKDRKLDVNDTVAKVAASLRSGL